MAIAPHPGEHQPGLAPCEPPATPVSPVIGDAPAHVGATGSTGRSRPLASHPRRDPRDASTLAELDVVGLTFVGAHQTVLQGQLWAACYPGRSEAVLSRRVHRLVARKLLGVDRFMAMGCNQLWLTEKGARLLVDGGHAAAAALFPRTRPIAPKDLGHHLTIVDLAILARRGVPFRATAIRPAWVLQRRYTPPPPAIPDLLLAGMDGATGTRVVLAYEVDLGGESLKVFLPKLALLADVLPTWANGGAAGVCILTRGAGRVAAISKAVTSLAVPMAVEILPRATGRASLEALAGVLSRGGGGLHDDGLEVLLSMSFA